MKKTAIAIIFVVSFLMSACFSPWRPDEAVLTLNLGGGADNRAVAYPPNEETEKNIEHTIHLSGPAEMDIKLEKGVLTAQITVTPGRWDITIQAFLDGELYAEGSGSVTVTAAQHYPVSIPMRYAGIHYYTVSFDSNGGTPVESQEIGEGGRATRPDDPEKAGYSFAGWYRNENLTAVYNFSALVRGDITLYAKWDAAAVTTHYTVTFDINDGSGIPTVPIPVAAGDSITLPGGDEEIIIDGYIFVGWNTKADGTGTRYSPGSSYKPTGDITLYAMWEEIQPGVFIVTFNSNGGSSVDVQHVGSGDTATRPNDPHLSGHTFDNWYSDSSLTVIYDFSTPVTDHIILYAKWTPIPPGESTVIFDSNGGSDVSVLVVESGGTVERPNDPTRDGYTFGGWYTEEGNEWHFATDRVTADITLYARWDAVTVTHTVTFNANGGTPVPAQQTIDHNGKVTEPAAMIKAGYAFGGWYKESAFGTAWNFTSDTVTGNITLYAKWSPVTSINIILWVDEAAGKIQVNIPGPITIVQSGNGTKSFTASFTESEFDVEWFIWGIPAIGDAAENNITIFAEDYNPGTYQLLVRVTKNGAPYSTEIAFTVTE